MAKKKTPAPRKAKSAEVIGETAASEKGRKKANVTDEFLVVGIGTSAGGLESLEKFFSGMPPNPGMAFVVVPHLEPKRQTLLPDLLSKQTEMAVTTAENGVQVRPNHVYVIPPGRDMNIVNGSLILVKPEELRGVRAPINHFLRSLANDMKERSVGIVLSGMGADGAAGLREIKGQLGLTIAQDPSSAKFDSMPESAVKTGIIDLILPPEQMPTALVDYAKSLSRHQPLLRKEVVDDKTISDLQKILIRLRAATGHDFSGYKRNTLLRRIERRIVTLHLDSIAQYAKHIYETPHEVELLFREILIGVTSFFRDPEAFDVIAHEALPIIFHDRNASDAIRIWVAGCSTGEEAYSLAILLREYMDKSKKEFTVQIFATDIDVNAVEAARAGLFPAGIAADVGEERLKKFFTKEDSSYRVRRDLREMIVFAVQDMIKDPPFTKLDLASCRNLLIYFTTELQKKLLPLLHYSLRPKGVLFLGSSETIGAFPYLFSPIDKKWKVFQRMESAMASRTVDFPFSRTMPPQEKADQKKYPEQPTLPQMIERALLAQYAPPAAVVTEHGDIVYIHGRTGEYLEPAQGRANLNIIEMAREGLRLQLPAALRKAVMQKSEVVSRGVRVKSNGGYHTIDVIVRPILEPASTHGLLTILFEEHKEPAKVSMERPRKGALGPGKRTDLRIRELEQELSQTKENLQSSIEELQSTNEELKSANEEYQSTNEEMQSTNEELETSKEELQSLNEELVTVNAELQGKFEELSRANADMKLFLDSLQVPTIFVDNELRIKRFTSQAPNLISVIETDMGRPISHIMTNLRYDKLVDDALQVVRTAKPVEHEVQTKDGRWYLMRIHPFKTQANTIEGLVITFLAIDELKLVSARFDALREMHAFADSVIQTIREPLIVLDEQLKVISANEAFYRSFRLAQGETLGNFVYDLAKKQWDIPRLRELLERILPEHESIEDFEMEAEFTQVGVRKLLVNARRLREQGKERILVAMEDVTHKK